VYLLLGAYWVPINRLHRRGTAIRDRLRINNRIRAREVRLIDEDGTQVGVIPIREALTIAEGRGMDLVEVAPNAVPPVCRVMDYGKFRYEQSKKEREARKNQRQVEIKQIRLEPKTDDHDLDVKAKQARRFLLEGDKVKFNLRFKGREIFHQNIGLAILEQMAENLQDIAIVEQRPLMEGRVLSLTLAPSPKAKISQQRRAAQPRSPDEQQAQDTRQQAAQPDEVSEPAVSIPAVTTADDEAQADEG
jgi:translation initiation factor IF-3